MAQPSGHILNNRYRIESPIAQGGFGTIYRAWDINLNTQVALKENLSTSSASLRQFTFEAQLLAKLRHANLPFVIDHFTIPEQGQYLVMEFVEGEDLQAILKARAKPFSEEEALRCISQISSAVAYLHAQVPPIIHRDIKPGNIKITPDGKAVLVDFGIAKVYQPSRHTTIGAKAITQGYSPPEQYGEGITDRRSDIYSLGATFYSLVTGRVPVESIQRHMGAVFLSPREINPGISAKTEMVILTAMALNPDERYQSADQLWTALSEREIAVKTTTTKAEMPKTVRTSTIGVLNGVTVSSRDVNGNILPPKKVIRVPIRQKTGQKASLTGIILLISLCVAASILTGSVLYYLARLPRWTQSSNAIGFIALTATESARLVGDALATGKNLATGWPVISQPASTPLSQLMDTVIPPANASSTLPPSPTDTPLPRPTWIPCANTYPSRLNVGDRASVSEDPPLPNRVRSLPDPDSLVIGYLDVAEKIEVLEGPVCSSTWIWWRVRSLDKNMEGWTAEGDADNYWLVPLP